VSVYPCSVCRQRKPGKLATAYWAWFREEGDRCAYKCRYCPDCAMEALHKLLLELRGMGQVREATACISCGSDANEDAVPIYLTLYLPKKEPEEFALMLDSSCSARIQAQIMAVGDPLADRGGLVRGPSLSTRAWDEMGLVP
jgi:hypothetical protein